MAAALIKLPAELFALAEGSRFEGRLDVGELRLGPDSYRLDEPVTWEADVTNTGEAFLVAGVAHATARTECARCLSTVEESLTGSIEGYFLIDPEQRTVDGMEGDEFDVLPANHQIDLAPLITAGLLMELPGVPLCSEDCAGLCPSCGADLNEGPCACGGDPALDDFAQAAHPFAALRGLSLAGDAQPGDTAVDEGSGGNGGGGAS
ncbi:DUF177 domain-containing protein [Berryella wangjianweii]|uniref:DUF177 domain-containing protein n=1 Tax=Berryella wangjianweii TaxID=2734634 RepID=A0A6M8IZN2_9ACTN|nr:DUF177 domain-containing protein [Berryella wangjianweii]